MQIGKENGGACHVYTVIILSKNK